jgi:hypothetical protein
MLDLGETINDLERRLDDPERLTALGRLTSAVLRGTGAKHPLDIPADDFNRAAEKYYRQDLRVRHLKEAFRFLQEKVKMLGGANRRLQPESKKSLHTILENRDPLNFLAIVQRSVIEGKASETVIIQLIHLILIVIHEDKMHDKPPVDLVKSEVVSAASLR